MRKTLSAAAVIALSAVFALADSTTRGYPLPDRRDQTSTVRLVERINEALVAVDTDVGSVEDAVQSGTNGLAALDARVVAETNRAIEAEADLLGRCNDTAADLVTETNRAIEAEALLVPLTAVFDTVTIDTQAAGNLTNRVTVQCLDAGGDNLAYAAAFQFWLTTSTVTTTPSTNNIESFSVVNGDVMAYFGVIDGANPVYLGRATAAGLFTVDVVGSDAGVTNLVYVLSPNGKLVSDEVSFE